MGKIVAFVFTILMVAGFVVLLFFGYYDAAVVCLIAALVCVNVLCLQVLKSLEITDDILESDGKPRET